MSVIVEEHRDRDSEEATDRRHHAHIAASRGCHLETGGRGDGFTDSSACRQNSRQRSSRPSLGEIVFLDQRCGSDGLIEIRGRRQYMSLPLGHAWATLAARVGPIEKQGAPGGYDDPPEGGSDGGPQAQATKASPRRMPALYALEADREHEG
ncbi:MAG: hypothetical protein ACRDVF_17850 [Microbacterium sp.]|uniref:hypothetical protein n=1 Tax=Microbacterium sp. TaxID=51671 RepID=UPI003D6FD7F8